MSDEGQRRAETCDRRTKAKIALLFLGLLFISHIPLWYEHRVVEFDAGTAIVLSYIGCALACLGPLLAGRWKPQLAGFDKTVLPRKWSGIGLGVAFVVLAYLTYAIVCHLARWLGLGRAANVQTGLEYLSLPYIVLQILLVAVAVPVAEEIFWRGYALRQFERLMPRPLAVVVQAGLWAAAHLYFIGPMIPIFVLGLMMGLWRQRMKSLLPLIVLHTLINGSWVIQKLWIPYREQQKEFAEAIANGTWASFEKCQKSPQGLQIRKLATKPPNEAVPGIIAYLGSEDNDIQDYALTTLVLKFGSSGAKYYAEALRSPDVRIVAEVEVVIGMTRCSGLIPQIREAVATSKDLRVQLSGVVGLWDLSDLEGLEAIAATHPSEKVRKAARRIVENLSRNPTAASGPTSRSATQPTSIASE